MLEIKVRYSNDTLVVEWKKEENLSVQG
jgi:hypothetical protein